MTKALNHAEPKIQALLSKLEPALRDAKRHRPIRVLLVGRTGVGKSSTINEFLGQQIAKVGQFKPTTPKVIVYKRRIRGYPVEVVDTPGLCDELPEKGNDNKYLSEIRRKVPYVDVLWFVTELGQTRVTSDEMRSIALISKALGKAVWERAVIVFSMADKVKKRDYTVTLLERTKLLHNEVSRCAGPKIARLIPAVAITNKWKRTPDGKPWLGELYTQSVGRISKSGAAPFFIATVADIVGKGSKKPRIPLTEQQMKFVEESYLEKLKRNMLAGADYGEALGRIIGEALPLFAPLPVPNILRNVGKRITGKSGALAGRAAGAILGALKSFIVG